MGFSSDAQLGADPGKMILNGKSQLKTANWVLEFGPAPLKWYASICDIGHTCFYFSGKTVPLTLKKVKSHNAKKKKESNWGQVTVMKMLNMNWHNRLSLPRAIMPWCSDLLTEQRPVGCWKSMSDTWCGTTGRKRGSDKRQQYDANTRVYSGLVLKLLEATWTLAKQNSS